MSDPSTTSPDPEQYDCIVISDLHLGSVVCQARLLEEFLEWAAVRTKQLIINGDIFDGLRIAQIQMFATEDTQNISVGESIA